MKEESTSIKEQLQMLKLNFETFLVVKDACTTSMIVTLALSDLLSAETGVHKHCTTSTLGETEFWHIHGSETRLHNLHRTTTKVKTTLSDLPITKTGVQKHCTTSTVVETGL